ncbi:hypothetical protein [Larkinella sp.]|uniref:hypothetical protein n=1 Tax=Larkinella sp. TaxID=2034517 RepID=UPI003BAC9B39
MQKPLVVVERREMKECLAHSTVNKEIKVKTKAGSSCFPGFFQSTPHQEIKTVIKELCNF